MARAPHCINLSSMDTDHFGDLEWVDGVAYCPRCLRFNRAMAAKRHPSALPPLNLAPLDPRRCYIHNRGDKFSCPECLFDVEVT